LEETDRQILELLAQNARLSVREIARRVGVSPGTVGERITSFEQRGVILGYHAQIEPAALGYGLQAIVGLQTTQEMLIEEILDWMMAVPEVEGIHVVTGQWDLVVRVRVRDHQHLREVILGKIWRLPAFRHSETMIVYETRSRPGGWNVALALSELPTPATDQSL
jgi:DNA-binding Lrp family transcriptional regulator